MEYYIENRNSIYEISNNELSIQKNLDRRVINKSEIEKIVVYMAPSVYQGSKLHLLPIEGYYYGAIYLKSGEQIIMTCLLTPEIEDILRQLSGVPLFRKKRLFNTLKWKD